MTTTITTIERAAERLARMPRAAGAGRAAPVVSPVGSSVVSPVGSSVVSPVVSPFLASIVPPCVSAAPAAAPVAQAAPQRPVPQAEAPAPAGRAAEQPQPQPQPLPVLADAVEAVEAVGVADAVAAEAVDVIEAPRRPPVSRRRAATDVPQPPQSSPPWWTGERVPPWTDGAPDDAPAAPAPAARGTAGAAPTARPADLGDPGATRPAALDDAAADTGARDPDTPDTSTPADPAAHAARGAVASARDQAVQAHGDDLPAESADTAVGTADADAHAVVVRGARSTRRGLDLPRMARDGLLVPGGPLHAGADEFRAVKRALLRSVAGAAQQGSRRANLVLVTSATPGEGKTWCATNLALSLAGEVDHAALLVDVAGGVPAATGLPPTLPGLLDLLAHPLRLSVADVMVASQIPKFTLLPLGAPTPHASELLASYAMDALLDELARRYRDRIVILDAPPVLGAGEVLHLAGQVGQVVMVVAQDRAPADAVRRAFATLQEHPRVMALFNRSASIGALHGRPGRGAAGG